MNASDTTGRTESAEDETVPVSFLKSFIAGQYRGYVQLQLLTMFLLGCLVFNAWNSASSAFAVNVPAVGWFCVAAILAMLGVIVAWGVLLRQRSVLVRDVVAAPVAQGDEFSSSTPDVITARRAEDGSEILYALARRLEAGGAATSYVDQVRGAAHAVYQLTRQYDGSVPTYPEDSIGASEHATEISQTLRPWR